LYERCEEVDVRSERGKSKNISIGTSSSLEGEKQWSQDRGQNLKYVESPVQ